MGLTVAGLEALDRHVGVDLGGGGRGMAEDLLDAAQVGAALEQVRGGGVADSVRADVAGGLVLAQPLVHDPARGTRVQAAAADADEQGRPAGPGGESGTARGQPARHGGQRGQPDRYGALLVALAGNPDRPAAMVEA